MQAPVDTSGYELIKDYGIIEDSLDSHLLYIKDTKTNNRYWLLTLYNNNVYCYFFSTDIISTLNINCNINTRHVKVFEDEDKEKSNKHICIFVLNEYHAAYHNYDVYIELYNEFVNTSGYILK